MRLVPISLAVAKAFIDEHHRHNLPPHGWKFGVGVLNNVGLPNVGLLGVGVAGRPTARALDDGVTIEITRVCVVDGMPNACSMIYGALTRASFALGYRKVITYTLQRESGASLRGAGFTAVAELADLRGWDRPKRPRVEVDLFGEERTPQEPKIRWEKAAAAKRESDRLCAVYRAAARQVDELERFIGAAPVRNSGQSEGKPSSRPIDVAAARARAADAI